MHIGAQLQNLAHLIFHYKERKDFVVIPIALSTYLRCEDEMKPNKIAFLL